VDAAAEERRQWLARNDPVVVRGGEQAENLERPPL
jgi:hypothetical protein